MAQGLWRGDGHDLVHLKMWEGITPGWPPILSTSLLGRASNSFQYTPIDLLVKQWRNWSTFCRNWLPMRLSYPACRICRWWKVRGCRNNVEPYMNMSTPKRQPTSRDEGVGQVYFNLSKGRQAEQHREFKIHGHMDTGCICLHKTVYLRKCFIWLLY